ncbi:hypothetical protein B0H13DRAFT_1922125 [Mycena leptocephala]|nr:hypothetical protein B0H13DRAFT_1922125 [Mycena leptocephala]
MRAEVYGRREVAIIDKLMNSTPCTKFTEDWLQSNKARHSVPTSHDMQNNGFVRSPTRAICQSVAVHTALQIYNTVGFVFRLKELRLPSELKVACKIFAAGQGKDSLIHPFQFNAVALNFTPHDSAGNFINYFFGTDMGDTTIDIWRGNRSRRFGTVGLVRACVNLSPDRSAAGMAVDGIPDESQYAWSMQTSSGSDTVGYGRQIRKNQDKFLAKLYFKPCGRHSIWNFLKIFGDLRVIRIYVQLKNRNFWLGNNRVWLCFEMHFGFFLPIDRFLGTSMTRPKTIFDPEARRARRQAALARYASKHKGKLRASAKERMRRIRTRPPTTTQKEGQLRSAAKYREINRDSIRAADSLRRAKKSIEANGAEAYDERVQRPLMAKTQHKYERRPPSPRPRPAIVSNAMRRTLEIHHESESGSESESELERGSDTLNDEPIPGATYGYGAARPRSPTPPDFHCNCILPAHCPKCTCGCNYMCCLQFHENESDYRRWMKELTREEEALRSQGLRLVSCIPGLTDTFYIGNICCIHLSGQGTPAIDSKPNPTSSKPCNFPKEFETPLPPLVIPAPASLNILEKPKA